MTALLDKMERSLLSVSRFGVWCGGLMMLAASLVIGVEVVLRKIFLVSLGGADEMASYALAIGTVWALSFALIERAHIRVDALYMRLPKRIGAACDILALASVLAFTGILTWFAAHVLLTSWSFEATANTPIGTPLWIPQGLWVLGLVVFVLTTIVLIWRTSAAFLAGDIAAVSRIAGTKSIEEELGEEVAQAEKLHMENVEDQADERAKSVESSSTKE